MSQFYDQASLVMVPSGYKAGKVYSQKPLSTDGQLTFTRNSNATRVNADGLLEKVRTNYLLQSQTFDNIAYGKVNCSITANNTTAPDGTATADKMISSATSTTFNYIQQLVTVSGPVTVSVYAKPAEITQFLLYASGVTAGVVFNLDGTFDSYFSGAGSISGYSITPAANGFYRYSVSFISSISDFQIYFSSGGSITLPTTAGDGMFIWGGMAEQNDIATDYIPTTSAAVSVGATPNTPRLDYSGGGCSRLILEPQRTNALLSSEDWTTNWGGANRLVTANQTASPDGYQNADKLSAIGGGAYYSQTRTTASGGNTFSVFLKYGNKTTQSIYAYSSGSYFGRANFNLQTGTISSTSSGTASIEDYGGGWYRCSVSGSAISSTIEIGIEGIGTSDHTYAWGAQLEAGSYATSYIPTLGASVSRLADSAFRTGVSSLIGQTEGTLFVEFNARSLSQTRRVFYTYQDGNNFIMLTLQDTNVLRFLVFAGGAIQANFTTPITTESVKMAGAYKANDFVFYVNGVQIGTDTSGTVPATSAVYVGCDVGGGAELADGISQALLFKTRLSNADLATLTTL